MLTLILIATSSDTIGARVHEPSQAAEIIDVFQKYGYNEVDTARTYGDGSSEEMLAAIHYQERGIVMDTKLYPTAGSALATATSDSYTHKPEDVRRGLINSLKALKTDKIDMFYLHGPDRKTPWEDTLGEVNKLHKEGLFNRFGISNYMSWEVAAICEICRRNDWISPVVYQGVYNMLQRTTEAELLPCLRKYNIVLYAFQPLAGGFLTGKFKRDQTEFESGSRFDPKGLQGKIHQARYWNDAYFDALESIEAVAKKNLLTIAEVAMRWLKHHSELKGDLGDAIIVGASSLKHLEDNLSDLEKGPLPDDVVEVVEKAWPIVKGVAPNYWH
jgi:aflatoxin B1 aldehyde reductase